MITADLEGVWTPVWQLFLLDDERAMRRGLTTGSLAAPHGTYVPTECFRVQATDAGDVENAIIDIYDARGNFIRFRWDETAGRWHSSTEAIVYTVPAGKYGYDKKQIPALKLTRHPTLALKVYTKTDAPHPKYVGRCHPTSLGDPATPVKLPPQGLEYKGDERHLEWKIEPWTSGGPILAIRRGFPPLDPERAKPGHNLDQKFGQAFITQSKLDQVSVSFCGFDPTAAGSYASKGLYSATSLGTAPQDTHVQNPGQLFQGALLFSFPRQDSHDYAQATYIEGSPNIPVGIWPEPVDVEEDDTHSTFVSSTTDEADSYSVSYGLSAGIDKLLSVKGSLAYSGRTETQRKSQSRFTVSRKVAKVWAAHLDIPSLGLHETYLGAIKTRTYDLLSDKSRAVGWNDDFVPTWGTHYANSITHGSLTMGKIWFSLQAEETAREKKVKIAASASGTLEGVSAGADFAVEQGWKSKAGFEVSQEDTQHFGIGTPDPVSIFLDLRPASELLSPIFLPYNEKDEWGKFAPWVWTDVRSDFEHWLTEQGLNQPIDRDRIEDYRPRRFTIKLQSLNFINVGDVKSPQGSGSVTISTPVSKQSTQFDLSQQIVSTADGLPLQWPKTDHFWAALDIDQNHDALQPGSANAVGCTIATTAPNLKAGAKGRICFGLEAQLWLSRGVMEFHGQTTVGGGGPSWSETEKRENWGVWDTRGTVVEIPSEDLPREKGDSVTKTVRVAPTARGPSGAAEAVSFTFVVINEGSFQD